MKALFILTDLPYGMERVYNALTARTGAAEERAAC